MPKPNSLYVFFGLIASGKSTLAQSWADRHQMAYSNSDVVRKELAGLAPTAPRRESVDQGIYSKEFSRKTYNALLDFAEQELQKGHSVVLDASYQSRVERGKVIDLAKRLAVQVYFLLCVCSEKEMRRRMEKRAADPNAVSDGRWEIYLEQKQRFEPPDELAHEQLITVNTDMPIDEAINHLTNMLTD